MAQAAESGSAVATNDGEALTSQGKRPKLVLVFD